MDHLIGLVLTSRTMHHQCAGTARNAMEKTLLLHKSEMLPNRIWALESEVLRDLLQRRSEAGFALPIFDIRQNLFLSACEQTCDSHTVQIYSIRRNLKSTFCGAKSFF
jgi:hypothetical protein